LKIAWFDCFSGISGDMCLGALVDAGAPLEEIEKGLKKLKLKGYALRERKVVRAGITATKVDVVLGAVSKSQKAEVRKWREIQKIINESAIPEGIKKQGFAIFKALFAAEAKVHGKTLSTTHLHELGCVDCLVDVFGTLIGLSVLDVGKIYASPVNVGSGRTKTSHGIFPVPAPATAELLMGIPCYASGPSFELTTPTGAAILTTLSSGFGDMPSMVNETIGTGAGSKDVQEQPNLLRIMIGEAYEKIPRGTVTVIETNIDDMNPQVYAYVMERLFERGALDVFMTQVIMKKSRPGTLLTVLCNAEKKNGLIGIILKETSTLGVRFYEAGRVTIKRDIKQVQTIYGRVRVKQSMLGDVLRIMPEYEDCRRIARENKVSLLQVLETAKRASLKK
jgi:pyridinium-3,5-bisthiocarboxylic acid mononucleotide nickel chelatase